MFDALLCYYIVLNIKHAGYFVAVADLALRAKTQWRAARRAIAMPATTVEIPPQTAGRSPMGLPIQEDWIRRLLRLESYVNSMG
jgi:hypothetical protein